MKHDNTAGVKEGVAPLTPEQLKAYIRNVDFTMSDETKDLLQRVYADGVAAARGVEGKTNG
jgi:hypothetical protein